MFILKLNFLWSFKEDDLKSLTAAHILYFENVSMKSVCYPEVKLHAAAHVRSVSYFSEFRTSDAVSELALKTVRFQMNNQSRVKNIRKGLRLQ